MTKTEFSRTDGLLYFLTNGASIIIIIIINVFLNSELLIGASKGLDLQSRDSRQYPIRPALFRTTAVNIALLQGRYWVFSVFANPIIRFILGGYLHPNNGYPVH